MPNKRHHGSESGAIVKFPMELLTRLEVDVSWKVHCIFPLQNGYKMKSMLNAMKAYNQSREERSPWVGGGTEGRRCQGRLWLRETVWVTVTWVLALRESTELGTSNVSTCAAHVVKSWREGRLALPWARRFSPGGALCPVSALMPCAHAPRTSHHPARELVPPRGTRGSLPQGRDAVEVPTRTEWKECM